MQQDEPKEFRNWLICVWEGKCHHHPWVWETTRTSGVVMMVSLCSLGCKEDGFNTSFVMSILLPLRESRMVGIFLFPFPVSVFKQNIKEHYLKNKSCLSCILIVPGKGTQSVSKGIWFIWSPNLYIRNQCCSVPLAFIGSTVVSVDLKISDNSFSVSPIGSAHVKPSNTTLIFMFTDRFNP